VDRKTVKASQDMMEELRAIEQKRKCNWMWHKTEAIGDEHSYREARQTAREYVTCVYETSL